MSRCSWVRTNLYYGNEKYHGSLRTSSSNNNNWILFALAPLFDRSVWDFSLLFLTFLIVFVCSGFFSLDLSRNIWFWLPHVLLLRLICLWLEFATCFDFSLIETELCSWATSNNFCLFEQLSLSRLFSASRIPILLWSSLTFSSTEV